MADALFETSADRREAHERLGRKDEAVFFMAARVYAARRRLTFGTPKHDDTIRTITDEVVEALKPGSESWRVDTVSRQDYGKISVMGDFIRARSRQGSAVTEVNLKVASATADAIRTTANKAWPGEIPFGALVKIHDSVIDRLDQAGRTQPSIEGVAPGPVSPARMSGR